MLKQTIKEDLNEAVKKDDEVSRSTLRMLLAAVLNREKEKKYKEKLEGEPELADEEMIEVISSEAKKRKEAITEYEKGGRKDLPRHLLEKVRGLADKEKAELEVLKKYLPEQLSEEKIRKLVEEAIKKVGASEIKDMGKVMAEIMPKIKGRADGGQVSKIVKELLSPR